MSVRETSTTRLRIGTFNVHQFSNGDSDHTFDGICRILAEADLDIIGLQEATGHLLPKLRLALGKEQQYTLAAKFGGTALLSRFPVEAISKPGNGRYCCCNVAVPMSASASIFSVAVVHLDHRREDRRMIEVGTIVKDFQRTECGVDDDSPQSFDFWLGDFNALTASDYSRNEWTEITNVRKRSHWELPVSDLTTAMTTSSSKTTKCRKKGAVALGLRDAFVESPVRKGPLGTSRFNTRIDYIFFRPQRLYQSGWDVVSCEHVDTKKILSDHNLVIATFENKTKDLCEDT